MIENWDLIDNWGNYLSFLILHAPAHNRKEKMPRKGIGKKHEERYSDFLMTATRPGGEN